MVKVYVDSMPTESAECPFFSDKNRKCRITDSKCCLVDNPNCEHLATFWISDEEEVDSDGLGYQDTSEEDN